MSPADGTATREGGHARARPVVGLTCAVEDVSWGHWRDVRAALLPWAYVRAVADAGGRAVLLPPDPEDTAAPEEVVASLDALLVSGGADLDPGCYGAAPHPRTANTNPKRDAFEIALAKATRERDLPLLGVCRGMQVLNVAYGGTLVQHLPEVVGHEGHNPAPGRFAEHEVRLRPDSLAAAVTGSTATSVRSHHHQGVDRVGDGLEVSGWHPADGIIEALEDPGATFCLGVLWHPEEETASTVIRSLVEAARHPQGLTAGHRAGSRRD